MYNVYNIICVQSIVIQLGTHLVFTGMKAYARFYLRVPLQSVVPIESRKDGAVTIPTNNQSSQSDIFLRSKLT